MITIRLRVMLAEHVFTFKERDITAAVGLLLLIGTFILIGTTTIS